MSHIETGKSSKASGRVKHAPPHIQKSMATVVELVKNLNQYCARRGFCPPGTDRFLAEIHNFERFLYEENPGCGDEDNWRKYSRQWSEAAAAGYPAAMINDDRYADRVSSFVPGALAKLCGFNDKKAWLNGKQGVVIEFLPARQRCILSINLGNKQRKTAVPIANLAIMHKTSRHGLPYTYPQVSIPTTVFSDSKETTPEHLRQMTRMRPQVCREALRFLKKENRLYATDSDTDYSDGLGLGLGLA